MGISTKRANEKKADFKKPKLKVGKAKAKAANFTDVSFKSKAIVIGEQFHQVNSKDDRSYILKTYLALASSSRSEKQRQSCLSHLTELLSDPSFAESIEIYPVFTKILPLLLDNSAAVRNQLIALLRCLPPHKVAAEAEQAIIFVRAGMTHLSVDISKDALAVMNWLLELAPYELVTCPGGWVKNLASCCALLGWSNSKNGGWSAAPSKSSLRLKDLRAAQIKILTRLINAGLNLKLQGSPQANQGLDDWTTILLGLQPELRSVQHVDILGSPRFHDCEICLTREARQQIFLSSFLDCIEEGAEATKKEGGALGRAAAALQQSARDGLADYEDALDLKADDIMSIW